MEFDFSDPRQLSSAIVTGRARTVRRDHSPQVVTRVPRNSTAHCNAPCAVTPPPPLPDKYYSHSLVYVGPYGVTKAAVVSLSEATQQELTSLEAGSQNTHAP